MTKGEFELQNSCIRISLNLLPNGLGDYFVRKTFAVQTLMLSQEFVMQIDLKHGTIAVYIFPKMSQQKLNSF